MLSVCVGRTEPMLSVCEVDKCNHAGTMELVVREDRALLRSNPSARTDAGTDAGSSRHGGSRSPSLFWPESDKPRGFGAEPPRQTLARCANCQDLEGHDYRVLFDDALARSQKCQGDDFGVILAESQRLRSTEFTAYRRVD